MLDIVSPSGTPSSLGFNPPNSPSMASPSTSYGAAFSTQVRIRIRRCVRQNRTSLTRCKKIHHLFMTG